MAKKWGFPFCVSRLVAKYEKKKKNAAVAQLIQFRCKTIRLEYLLAPLNYTCESFEISFMHFVFVDVRKVNSPYQTSGNAENNTFSFVDYSA